MARSTTKAGNAPAMPAEPVYTEVTLSRASELQGHLYRPGVKHVVDAVTLAALGDAVATKRPLNA